MRLAPVVGLAVLAAAALIAGRAGTPPRADSAPSTVDERVAELETRVAKLEAELGAWRQAGGVPAPSTTSAPGAASQVLPVLPSVAAALERLPAELRPREDARWGEIEEQKATMWLGSHLKDRRVRMTVRLVPVDHVYVESMKDTVATTRVHFDFGPDPVEAFGKRQILGADSRGQIVLTEGDAREFQAVAAARKSIVLESSVERWRLQYWESEKRWAFELTLGPDATWIR